MAFSNFDKIVDYRDWDYTIFKRGADVCYAENATEYVRKADSLFDAMNIVNTDLGGNGNVKLLRMVDEPVATSLPIGKNLYVQGLSPLLTSVKLTAGVDAFTMRMNADNFPIETLPKIAEMCHNPSNPSFRKRKAYLTTNIVIYEDEIADLSNYYYIKNDP